MAKNFYLDALKSEKEYEQNRPGIIYKITGHSELLEDGIYIQFMGQTIPQEFKFNQETFRFELRPYRTYIPFENQKNNIYYLRLKAFRYLKTGHIVLEIYERFHNLLG